MTNGSKSFQLKHFSAAQLASFVGLKATHTYTHTYACTHTHAHIHTHTHTQVLIPAMKHIIDLASEDGVESFVIGMPHR